MRVDANISMMRDTQDKRIEEKREPKEIKYTEKVAHEPAKVDKEVEVELTKKVEDKPVKAERREGIKTPDEAKAAVKNIKAELTAKPEAAMSAQANSDTNDVLFLLQGA